MFSLTLVAIHQELLEHRKYTGNIDLHRKFNFCILSFIVLLFCFRDPRQRLLAEQQKQMSNKVSSTVPEKLSFKEKMKMFAMETGEDGTPKDKVKISKAQREIDNLGAAGSPLTN